MADRHVLKRSAGRGLAKEERMTERVCKAHRQGQEGAGNLKA